MPEAVRDRLFFVCFSCAAPPVVKSAQKAGGEICVWKMKNFQDENVTSFDSGMWIFYKRILKNIHLLVLRRFVQYNQQRLRPLCAGRETEEL